MSAKILQFVAMDDHPNRIRELRMALRLSQQDLADRVGCSKMQISGLERGKPLLDINWMRRIAPALGVLPADLLTAEDNPMRLSEEERLLISSYRCGDEDQQATLLRVSDAIVPLRSRDAA